MLDFEDGVEAVEEGLEVHVLGVLHDAGNARAFGFVVAFDEALSDYERVFLFFSVGLLADPDEDLFVKLQNKSVVCIQHLPRQGSLSDF